MGARRSALAATLLAVALAGALAIVPVAASGNPDPGAPPGSDASAGGDGAGEATEAGDGEATPAPVTSCRPHPVHGDRVSEMIVAGQVAIRLRGETGGMSPADRCRAVADRLERVVGAGQAERIRPVVMAGAAAVAAGDSLIVTALEQEAEANRATPAVLAWIWANGLRAALGQPQLGLDAIPYKGLSTVRPAVASWYGYEFKGARTASGEPFNPRRHTAAHPRLPFGTVVRVIYPRTGKQVMVSVNDRGPFVRGRDIDLSYAAAQAIGLTAAGVATVYVEVVRLPGD